MELLAAGDEIEDFLVVVAKWLLGTLESFLRRTNFMGLRIFLTESIPEERIIYNGSWLSETGGGEVSLLEGEILLSKGPDHYWGMF